MPDVRVVHWRAAEAKPLIEACRRAGFEVDYTDGDGSAVCRAIRAKVPDVIVIDLSRLPSHGREVGVWLRGAKPTRKTPLVFVAGDELKIDGIRRLLPDANYCGLGTVGAVLKKVLTDAPKRSAADPVVPPGIMQRWTDKSAVQKLGIGAGAAVAVIEPPRDFPALLGVLPEPVEFQDEPAPITLWFVHETEQLLGSLRRMRALAGRTKLWLLWRKASGNGITQNSLREATREVGLVDYKICSVDDRWSAMLFARKKA